MKRAVFRILSLLAVLCIAAPLAAANERIAGFSADDTITIRSAEARMDEQTDIIHFGGSFEIRANDFYLLSEQASLYGKLDDPETIVVTGSPATISVNTILDGRTSTIYGQAARIVYQRDANSIRMEGAASLSRDGHTLTGSEMEYDVETDYLRAGGDGGVHIRIRPDGP